MSFVATVAGAAAILAALRDMFLTLLDPAALGRMSDAVSRTARRLSEGTG